MNIGDKVRLLHGKEEGVVTKFIGDNLVEIEIEDGFQIPVKTSEVVVVAQEEAKRFKRPRIGDKRKEEIAAAKAKSSPIAHKGIFVAFTAINDQKYSMYLINNTDFATPFVVGEEESERYQGVYTGLLKSKDSIKIREVNIQNFEHWGVYVFQLLFFSPGTHPWKAPFIKRIRFRAKTFFQNMHKAPVLEKEAHLFQIDKEEGEVLQTSPVAEKKTMTIDPVALKEKMMEKQEAVVSKQTINIPAPKIQVDLHIETLTSDYQALNSSEIIQLQLKTFESNLESAIANGLHYIIFIHGVGNGKLRQEIHKKLSGNPDIQFFEDAQKGKFGYGATKITLK